MNATNNIVEKMIERIYNSDDAVNVLEVLDELDRLQDNGELTIAKEYMVRREAFRALKNLTEGEPQDAREIILQHLLPLCVKNVEEAKIELRRLREILAKWVYQYSGVKRHSLRKDIINKLISIHNNVDLKAFGWSVAVIGYREEEVASLLIKLADQHNDEVGDSLISSLTSLGTPPSIEAKLVSMVHARCRDRYNNHLAGSLMRLAHPSSIDIITDYWLNPKDFDINEMEVSIILSTLSTIADKHYKDAKLQKNTLAALREFSREYEEKTKGITKYSSKISSSINRQEVPGLLLDVFSSKPEDRWNNYLVGLRLEGCTRPMQLEGMEKIQLDEKKIKILEGLACENTGKDLFSPTEETYSKEMSWKTALRLELSNVFDWMDKGITNEDSRFTRQHILELLSVFEIRPLPGYVKEWITEEFDQEAGNKDSREVAQRLAATRLAHSAATKEAFSVLINFGLTHKGKGLRKSSEAIKDVALELIRNGDHSVVEDLVKKLEENQRQPQRDAAVKTLEIISSTHSDLLIPYQDVFMELAKDPDTSDYEKGKLIGILGSFQYQEDAGLTKHIHGWALNSEGWVREYSLEYLYAKNNLHTQEEILEKVLGLQKGQRPGWQVKNYQASYEWAPHMICRLYEKHPNEYKTAIVNLIENSNWRKIRQVYRMIRHIYNKGTKGDKPGVVQSYITDALIKRVYQKQTKAAGETDVFYLLATISPTRLITEEWENVFDEWLPDVKVALTDSISGVELKEDIIARAKTLLLELGKDETYAVRRAAYHALSISMPTDLVTLFYSWSESQDVELRKRALEVWAWIDEEEEGVKSEYAKLSNDKEKEVREAAGRLAIEKREMEWASAYLDEILNLEKPNNDKMLKAWKYGEALKRIGNNYTSQRIRKYVQNNKLKPNIQYWFSNIVKGIEDSWSDKTKEWPEPWVYQEGEIREGSGVIWFPSGETLDINYSLWYNPANIPSELHSWGGVVWPIPLMMQFKFQDYPQLELSLRDGGRGEILPRNIKGEYLVFYGQGAYPEKRLE